MKRALVVILTACGGDDPTPDPDAGPDPDGPVSVINPLLGVGQVELVDGGYEFTEGPQWRETEQDLVFTDIPASIVYRYVPGGAAPAPFRDPSDMANGLAIASDGAMFAAEHGSRSITRTAVVGQTTTVVGEFEGTSLNSPNDLVFAADGTLYFTDPPFGISGNGDLGFMGVFRFVGTTLTVEHRGALAERPNGIGISPDGTRLYVAYSNDGVLYRFPIEAGGALGTREIHATTSGTADGLAIDAAGNIFVTSVAGVEVFAADGSKWGTIEVPERPSNCAFGDADHKTLYITARTSLYRVSLVGGGLPNN